LFVVLGSDGLFDFFSNDEVVQLVYQFMHDSPFGDPAKYLIEQVVHKAAKQAGIPQIILNLTFDIQILRATSKTHLRHILVMGNPSVEVHFSCYNRKGSTPPLAPVK
jgi:hypothetical protein